MSSVFEMLAQQLEGQPLSEISSRLGVDETTAKKAVPAALASLMGGLAGNAAQRGGAESLLGALTRDHDGSALEQISDLISSPERGPGAGILRHVFGGNQEAVTSGLSRTTGLDSGSVGQLLAMLAPLVMGALGRTQRQQGLDAGALAGMLGGEKEAIARRAPEGLGVLGQLLDADGDGQVADDVAKIGAGLLGRLFGRRR